MAGQRAKAGLLVGAFFGGVAAAALMTTVGSAWAPGPVATLAPERAAQIERVVLSARAQLDDDDVLERLNAAIRRVATAVEPSVVHVAVQARTQRGRSVRLAQGSGWLYDDQGHVVTNAHVVQDAPGIVVQLFDGRSLEARVVGADAATDIAVLKIDGANALVPARRATGEVVSQGDRVFAFGSPFGFKFSMSEGIVSGLARDPGAFANSDGYTNFIQSDAAINPGNSGGPLVDVRGRVVGMNVAIANAAAPDGGPGEGAGQSAGIAFAIPLSTIEPIVAQLITRGSVSKGFLGINMATTEELNRAALARVSYLGEGVAVTGVLFDGPADAAGLRTGDVIVGLQGQRVANVAQLRSMVATRQPGERVALTVWRGGQLEERTIRLGDLDANRASVGRAWEALRAFGVEARQSTSGGVVVGSIVPGSPAERSGVAPDQMIVTVHGRAISSLNELGSALALSGLAEGRRVAATLVGRDGQEREITLRLPE